VRIARVLTRLNLGGPARQALGCDPELAARGHEVRVFAGQPETGEGDLFEAFRARGVAVERVPGLARGLAPASDLRALVWLRSALARFDPDVVHTHASKAGALGRRAARAAPRAAVVHTFHGHVLEGYFPKAMSAGLVAFEKRLAKRTDRIIAVSHATAEDLLRLGIVADERRLVVVPPGIDLAPLLALEPRRPGDRGGSLRELLGAVPGDFVVGVVGRLAEVKQPERALAVFAMLAGRHPGLHLVYVGDGNLRGMIERAILALEPDLRRRAHLVGAREDMAEVQSDLDAVMLCSRTEGLPIALIEAAAAGLPVVASDVGGVGEIVAHERTGFLGKDDDELAFGLDQLLASPARAREMGQRARTRVATRHAAARLADRLEEIYRIVVEERACAS
jgi:glycosyltransferase involved in cell wall biosynthesis